MPFTDLDATAVARCLSQVADREGDLAEAFFERREDLELPAAENPPGIRAWREEGFAVRLIRAGAGWLAARDGIESSAFLEALRQVARLLPSTPFPEPLLPVAPFPPSRAPEELIAFPQAVTRAIRERWAAFPLELRVRCHRRWVRVVGTRVAPELQAESFFSYEADMPWGRHGALLSRLDEGAVERVAATLTLLFRSREAPVVESGPRTVVLGPAATAVLLHEVVAHALEIDTLAVGGKAESAIGVRVGSDLLDVLDDPGGAPEGVRRSTDDEGVMVVRRWLLRKGAVEQPLADLLSAHHSTELIAGAGRRSDRHQPPVPRSTHLELLPGPSSLSDLLSDIPEGLFLPEVSQGRLDPLTGRFALRMPCGRRIRRGALGDLIGPCRLVGWISELLEAVEGVGDEALSAGAGWCAKGGVKLPVWATAPALRLRRVEVMG